jgi:hypothetical protein
MSRFDWLFKRPGSGPDAPLIRARHSAPADEAEAGVVAALESAIAEHRARRWAVAEPLFDWVIQHPSTSRADRHVARNLLGNLLERTRRTDEAISQYEANVSEGFSGSYPYERLAEIYRRQRRPEDELRVLRRAVAVIEQQLAAGHPEVVPQLERLQTALSVALRRHGLSAADEPRG